MFRLVASRYLRSRPIRAGLSATGLIGATALVVALFSIITSIEQSARRSVELAGTATFEVIPASDTGVPVEVVDLLLDDPDVISIGSVYELPAIVNGETGTLIVPGPGYDTFGGSLLESIAETSRRAEGGIAVSASVAQTLGVSRDEMVTAIVGGQVAEVELTEVVDSNDFDNLAGTVFIGGAEVLNSRWPDALPTRLLVGLEDPNATSTEIASAQGRLNDLVGSGVIVRTPDDRRDEVNAAAAVFVQPTSLLAMLGSVVAAFLVFNTMSLAVGERLGELAVLRSLGATRSRMLSLVVVEALCIGVIGSAIGTIVGTGLGRQAVSRIPDIYDALIGVSITYSFEPIWVVVAWLLGIVATLAGALVPARRAASAEPFCTMKRRSLDPAKPSRLYRPFHVGLVVFGVVGMGICGQRAAAGGLAIGALALAFVCMLVTLIGLRPWTGVLAARVARMLGSGGFGVVS